jgi:3-deoxy-D-manno-octulosonate 8-phosphate phosphatase (KDO 8-P phosphatase)
MKKPLVFILDIDGVLTDGKFFYTEEGKAMKAFGPDDNDAISLLRPFIEVRFVTGDRKGFNISKRRVVDDMQGKLDLVSTIKRVDWIQETWSLDQVIYMGDGIFDHYVFHKVAYAIAPANADEYAKSVAHFVTKRAGGERAVAEAALHILDKFFEPYDPDQMPQMTAKLSGEWAV